MERIRIESRQAARNCPYCRAALIPGEEAVACGGCETRYHAECWGELGGCATLGCRPRGEGVQARARPGGPRVGAQRYCHRCGDAFRVRADNRFSAFCAACARRRVLRAVALALVVAPLYLAMQFWPMLVSLLEHLLR